MVESLEQSIKKYSEELAKNPKSRAFVPLADAYRASGRTEEAIEVAKQGVAHYPHYVGGKMALARAYFEHGETESAQQLLEEILHTAPDNLLANRILAEIYQQSDNRTKAIPLLKRLLTLEPNDERAKTQLADLELLSTPTDELPVESFSEESPLVSSSAEEKVEEVVPDEEEEEAPVEIRTATMAEMYRSQGHLEEALSVYRDLVQREPDHPQHRQKMDEILHEIRARRESSGTPSTSETRAMILGRLLKQVQERRRSL